MPIIKVEINDILDEKVEAAIDEVKEELKSYIKENDSDSLPDFNNDLDYSGAIHDIIDGCVPVYTKVIEDQWYLHKNKLIQAYEDAGLGDNPLDNDGMTAIYCYIKQKVSDWYKKEAQDFFDELKNK